MIIIDDDLVVFQNFIDFIFWKSKLKISQYRVIYCMCDTSLNSFIRSKPGNIYIQLVQYTSYTILTDQKAMIVRMAKGA